MILKKLIKLIGIFSVLFALIGFFPSMYNIFSTFYYRDVILNYYKYEKKYIVIDSLQYINNDGSDADKVNGYAKQLNNYKTKILFGIIKKGERIEGMDDNGVLRRFIWYRDGIDFAFPAEKQDKLFPVKKYIYTELKIPFLWLTSLLIFFLVYKISKKSNLFKQANEDEKNN